MNLYRVQFQYVDNTGKAPSEYMSLDLLLNENSLPQSNYPTFGLHGTFSDVKSVFLLGKNGEMKFNGGESKKINMFEGNRKVRLNELYTISENDEDPYVYRIIKIHKLI